MRAEDERELMVTIFDPRNADNPFAFVKMIYPWGKKGTPLEHFEGPRGWQRDELLSIADFIADSKERKRKGDPLRVYQSATASGRGIGKSALVSWIQHWFMSTRFGGTAIVSANTEAQLKNVTWGEIGKWKALSLNTHWFDMQALSVKPTAHFADMLKKQFQIDSILYATHAKLWSEENPDAFAGVHNQIGELVVFDEASGIPASIWKVTSGYFTDPIINRYWFAFSNPRRNQGMFFDCFHHPDVSPNWKTRNLDSRSVDGADLAYLNQIIKENGEESDAAKVEVKGQFPGTGDKQFISTSSVHEAQAREPKPMEDPDAPLIMGVDPARFGSDSTVIRFRQGRLCSPPFVPEPLRYRGKDNMFIADEIVHLANKFKPDAICIDAGSGTGVIDRAKQRGVRVHEVWFGGKADDADKYGNKRAELWGRMRDWVKESSLQGETRLGIELTGPEFKFQGNSDKLLLESKDDMKKRGVKSPDDADALACTFAVKVSRRGLRTHKATTKVARDMDYDIFGG